MRLLRGMGLESLAWSVRRFHCPVDHEALVLEVGSGGNPYARANVLLDAFENTRQRHWVPLVADRPTVLGFVERLPFKDKVFDFVIASHVLEHSANPERFLSELQRVAKAGYIEVPDAFMERINPYRDHKLEITMRENKLLIRKKKAWVEDGYLVELYEHRVKSLIAGGLIPRHPFSFHVRYYWQNQIDFEILNPELDAGWDCQEARAPILPNITKRLHDLVLDLLRGAFSQKKRNKIIKLMDLLACPVCGNSVLSRNGNIVCGHCGTQFPIKDGVPRMFVTPEKG